MALVTKYNCNDLNIIFFCSDLSSIPELKGILLDSFSSQSEEVKTAASFALGLYLSFFL